MNVPLPRDFVARLESILPPAVVDEVLASFAAPRATVLRVNTLRAAPEAASEDLQAAGLHPRSACDMGLPEALILPAGERRAALAHPLVGRGVLYAQGISSMLATAVLAPKPEQTVLDLCAAPGGKTGHLWQRMQARGRLVAIEAVKKRFFKLRGVLAGLGMAGIETRCMDGRAAWRWLAGRCDCVMLDAPCSSEARFRIDDPASFRYWSPRKIKEMRHKQRGLLRAGIRCLKPGGVLLYATCSFAPEENEQVIADALRVFGEVIAVEPVELPAGVPAMPGLDEWRGRGLPEAVTRAVRVLPGPVTTGFFLCRIRRLA
ncbi:MAG: RsmB/NOP family class I SAM-dependent RNA methyltransferase [Mariprofundaceae bacterium]